MNFKNVFTIMILAILLLSPFTMLSLVDNAKAFEQDVSNFDRIWYDEGGIGFNKAGVGTLILAVTYTNATADNPNFREIDYCDIGFYDDPFYLSITVEDELHVEYDYEGNIIYQEPADGYMYLRKSVADNYLPDDIKELASKSVSLSTITFQGVQWYRIYCPDFNREYIWKRFTEPVQDEVWFTWGSMQSIRFNSRAMYIKRLAEQNGLEFDITHDSNTNGQQIAINKTWLESKGINNPIFELQEKFHYSQISYSETSTHYLIYPSHFTTIGIHEAGTGFVIGGCFITNNTIYNAYGLTDDIIKTGRWDNYNNALTNWTHDLNYGIDSSSSTYAHVEALDYEHYVYEYNHTTGLNEVPHFSITSCKADIKFRLKLNYYTYIYLEVNGSTTSYCGYTPDSGATFQGVGKGPLTFNGDWNDFGNLNGTVTAYWKAGYASSGIMAGLFHSYLTVYASLQGYDVNRTSGAFSEVNNINFTCIEDWAENVTIVVPVSEDTMAITNVTNNTAKNSATEVDSYADLVNNTYWYDSANQRVCIRTTNLSAGTFVNWTINCSKGVTFSVVIPQYLEAGDLCFIYGKITDSDGNDMSGISLETHVYQNGIDQLNPVAWNCTGGNVQIAFYTTALSPGIYQISMEFEDPDSGLIYKEGGTLYLSTEIPYGSGIHASSQLNFLFYDANTGEGLSQDLFKLYVSEDTNFTDDDRIYHSYYNTVTDETLYYKVLDYFDNIIYPTNASYTWVNITKTNQFEDIPISWNSFSVKNMNHSIVYFKMTNESITYSQYLYPYEPFYWKVLSGNYDINLTYYDSAYTTPDPSHITGYTNTTISITDDTYYWIVGYDLQDIIIEITNTNTTIMDQIVNIGVNISNEGCDIINQTLNLAYYLSNLETNVTSQINAVWFSVNNTNATIVTQSNLIQQAIDNTETIIINQINSVWQAVNNSDSTQVLNQLNLVWQSINNSNSSIMTQVNAVNQNVDNLNSTIQTQVNYIIQNITNAEGNITTQINSAWQTINNTNSTIHTQINNVLQEVQNANSTIHTQINAVTQQIDNFETNISTQINSVSIKITNTESNITTQINGVSTSITNMNTSINTQINSLETIVTNINSNVTTQFNQVDVEISNLNTNLTNQINSVIIEIQNTNSSIQNQLNSIISQISNIDLNLTEQTNIIVNNITNTKVNITNQLNTIKSSIATTESNLTAQINIVSTAITNANTTLHTQINGISVAITNTETNITNQLNTIELQITNTNSSISNQINDVNIAITNTNTTIHNQLNTIETAINNNKGDIIDQVNLIWNAINNTNSSILTQINGMYNSINVFWSDVNTTFAILQNNITYSQTNITNLIDEVNATLYAKLIGVLDNVSSAGVSVFEKVEETLTSISNVNTSLFNEIQSQALDIMINITEQTDINLNSLNNLINTLGTITGDTFANAITNMSNQVDEILSVVNNLTINITGNLSANFTEILNTLEEVLGNISLVNVSLGDMINVSIGDLNNVTIRMWEQQNSSFQDLQGRSVVVFNFYNTNVGLGLDRETLQIYVNGSRLINNLYYVENGSKINLTIKDYYNFTLYHNNFTITSAFTFIDLGLTFHSWKFGNKNNVYYMVSLLKEGGARWWERGIVPYGEIEFIIPSGNYTMRIYDRDNTELHNQSYTVNNSRVYVIEGNDIDVVISGQSVIQGQLLELASDLYEATLPEIVSVCYNLPSCYSIYETQGALLGTKLVCPALFVMATTVNESTINGSTVFYPLIPDSDTDNGTITVKEDVMYFAGDNTVTWVNVSYGSITTNYSYIPNHINLFGQNVTVNTNGNLTITRETEYQQLKKFYWTKYTDTLYYSATVSVFNPFSNTNITEVYIIIEFANDTTPDFVTARLYDVSNGVYLTRGENFFTTASGIHFYLDSIGANTTRQFTGSYYGMSTSQISSDAIVIINDYQMRQHVNTDIADGENWYYASAQWINPNDESFIGSIYIQFNFDTDPYIISKRSFDIYDRERGIYLDRDDFTWADGTIIIKQEVVGTVQPNGARTFDIYFLFISEDEEDTIVDEAQEWIKQEAFYGIQWFYILEAIILLITVGFASIAWEKRKRWEIAKREGWVAFFALFFAFILWIWYINLP